MLRIFVMGLCLFMVGCGSTSDEVPPLAEPGTDPPPEQQRDWMEESRRHGSSAEGPPAADESATDTTN